MKEAEELMRALHDRRGRTILCALRSLSNPLRLKLLAALLDQRLSVTEICQLTGAQQSAASNQLSRLRLDGLVTFERDGHTIYYSLCHEGIRDILSVLNAHRAPILLASGRPDKRI
jgi:ArsR family transcriptional regulator, virulence genes transcriptional regulator